MIRGRWATRSRERLGITTGLCTVVLAACLALTPATAVEVGHDQEEASQGKASLPSAFLLEFELERGGVHSASAQIRLRPLGDGEWLYQRRTRAAGWAAILYPAVITESSRWTREAGAIRPHAYTYRRTGNRPREVDVNLDWEAGRAANTLDGETWSMTVPPRTQDKLSVELAMIEAMTAGRPELDIPVADGGHLKTYTFQALGEEELDTELGRLRTLMVERLRDGSDRTATYWLAVDHHHLPVQVIQYEAGETANRMTLTRMHINGRVVGQP
ncbi:MAG: DUF3108 domain-containing protein [Gammaproteobacteria bacterium]